MIQIRMMQHEDLEAGMRLKEQAGWNQTIDDWRRMLDLEPGGGWAAVDHGQVVGTVLTCRFGPVAWIAMMLVDAAQRGRGIGRALMTQALGVLERDGVESVRLDATPLGRPLYESLGFRPESVLVRYAGILPFVDSVALPPWPVAERCVDQLVALDRAVTHTDRRKLIARLVAEHADSLRVVEDEQGVAGFLLARPGSRARQIGPCIAAGEAGVRLLADAARRYAGQTVVLDVPVAHATATAVVREWGLEPARELLRMGLGPQVVEDASRLWVGAGPEKG